MRELLHFGRMKGAGDKSLDFGTWWQAGLRAEFGGGEGGGDVCESGGVAQRKALGEANGKSAGEGVARAGGIHGFYFDSGNENFFGIRNHQVAGVTRLNRRDLDTAF